MPCPFFYPVRPRASARPQDAMLPLGDLWAGQCRAVETQPIDVEDGPPRPRCNIGYVRGECPRFPAGEGPDAARFTVTADEGASVRLCYVVERDHHPSSHGTLEYSRADGALVNPPAGAALARQAQAYIESYLRRKERR